MQIVYLLGLAHCGSTYVSRILNQHPDIFAAGELLNLHDFTNEQRGYCSCGKTAIECPFWNEVHQHLNEYDVSLEKIARLSHDRRIEWMKALMGLHRSELFEEFGELNRSFFKLLENFTECPVILDSSKTLWRGLPLFHEIPELKVLHLIKSPENQIASRRKRGYNFWHSAILKYGRKNWLATRFFGHSSRYLKVQFEQFVNHPEQETERMHEWLDLSYENPYSKPSEPWHHMRGSRGELARPDPQRLEHEIPFTPLQKRTFDILQYLYR